MIFYYKGCRINYTDSGDGHVIVLLHGYLETSEVWNGFATKLASHNRVLSIDLPGHGLSESCGESHTMEYMATGVKELLDNAGIRKAFIAGHSMGGYVTLAFLDLFPEYLSGYCLVHSQPFADSPETVIKRKNEIALVSAGKKEQFYPESIRRMYANSNTEKFSKEIMKSTIIASGISDDGIIAVLNGMMARPSRAGVMEEGRVPCLWILGALDNYIDCNLIVTKVNLPSNADIAVLRNSGHMGFIEEQDMVIRILREYLEDLESRRLTE
jgi:pimeloyl-ACP methyl ester carboxylesterase